MKYIVKRGMYSTFRNTNNKNFRWIIILSKLPMDYIVLRIFKSKITK